MEKIIVGITNFLKTAKSEEQFTREEWEFLAELMSLLSKYEKIIENYSNK